MSGSASSSAISFSAPVSVSATRSRSATGAVLYDVPIASSSLIGLHGPCQLLHLARDPGQLRGQDRDVDQDQPEEDHVGGGHVLAGLVERQRGHQRLWGAAERRPGRSASKLRLRRRRRIEVCLASSSYLHSVTNSTAMPTIATPNVSAIL